MSTEEIEFLDEGYDDGTPRCLTCDKTLAYAGRGRKPKFCDEHKPARKSTASRPRSGTGGTIPKAKAVDAVAKILLILTAISAHSQCKRLGLANNEQLEDDLAMTDDEADAIAAPVARWAIKSKTGARVLGPVIENDDLIDAGIAMFEYHRRTSQILKSIRSANHVAVQSSTGPQAPRTNGVIVGDEFGGFNGVGVGRSLI